MCKSFSSWNALHPAVGTRSVKRQAESIDDSRWSYSRGRRSRSKRERGRLGSVPPFPTKGRAAGQDLVWGFHPQPNLGAFQGFGDGIPGRLFER